MRQRCDATTITEAIVCTIGKSRLYIIYHLVIMSVLFKPIARWYQREVTKQLSKYGLRYEDMLVESADVHRAHSFMSEEDRVGRDRRLKRAIDLNLKHVYLPEEIQSLQTPLVFYLSEPIEGAKQLREERELLQ